MTTSRVFLPRVSWTASVSSPHSSAASLISTPSSVTSMRTGLSARPRTIIPSWPVLRSQVPKSPPQLDVATP